MSTTCLVNLTEKEQSLKSEYGNLAESRDNGYLPSKNNLDGVQSVAPSSAKIQQSSEPPNKKLEIITYRFKNIENYAKTISSSG